MNFKHVISTQQFLERKLLDRIFKTAEELKRKDSQGIVPKILKDKILVTLFYEPSTRTRFSFESAMLKLGGGVISTESAGHFSSAIKGETLEEAEKEAERLEKEHEKAEEAIHKAEEQLRDAGGEEEND